MSHKSKKDRRTHPRFAALSPALLVDEAGICSHCFVEDLSAGGARISGINTLVVGEHVRLLLQLPGRGPFSLAGQVVRAYSGAHARQAAAFGIAFVRQKHGIMQTSEETVEALKTLHGIDEPVVLVVHDQPRVCYEIVQELMRVGRRAIAVTTSLDAIEWLLDGASHIDAALVHGLLGNADGCDLLNFLAEEYPQVRRVVLTEGETNHVLSHAHPDAILARPWDDDQLAKIFSSSPVAA